MNISMYQASAPRLANILAKTAYNILRRNGVEIGKRDFVGNW